MSDNSLTNGANPTDRPHSHLSLLTRDTTTNTTTNSSRSASTDREPTEDIIAIAVSQAQGEEVDPQILEALRSKDRLYVLKLGEQLESLIIDKRWGLSSLDRI